MGIFDRIKKGLKKNDEVLPSETGTSDISASPKICISKGADVLASWRLEELQLQKAFIKHEPPKPAEPKRHDDWPDEASRKAEERLRQKGIKVPWRYDDAFGDDFKVIGLRAGGCGVVFFVESARFGKGRLYAAKTLRKFLEKDYLSKSTYEQKQIANAFLEEALPWLEMGQHANIVTVHLLKNIIHPETKRNVPFVFSEFMEHGSLSDFIARKGRRDLRETIYLGIQLCDGLLHAYEYGGLPAHKDLKPDNIMVYGNGLYKVIDFSSGVAGTPGYMAPEQVAVCKRLKNERIDHRADQFSIGLILYDALKGNPENEQRKRMDYVDSNPEDFVNEGFKGLLNSIPAPLNGIVAFCLSPKPEDRYDNISSLKDALLRAYGEGYQLPRIEMDDSAEWWFNRGISFYEINRYSSAEKPFVEAFSRVQEFSDKKVEKARCLLMLGIIYDYMRRYSDALLFLKKAYEIFKQTQKTEMEQASCLMSMGIASCNEERLSDAMVFYKEALQMFGQMTGTEEKQAICLMNMGIAFFITEMFPDALNYFKKAFNLFIQIPGTELEQAKCLKEIGLVYQVTGKLPNAADFFKRALAIFSQIPGTEISQARCLLDIGTIYYQLTNYTESENLIKEALSIFRQFPKREIEQASCIASIGNINLCTGNYAAAEEKYKESVIIYRQFSGTEKSQALSLMNIATVFRNTSRFKEATAEYEEALHMFKSLPGTAIDQARCLLNMGILNYKQNKYDDARSALHDSLNICDQYPRGTEGIKHDCQQMLSKLKDEGGHNV